MQKCTKYSSEGKRVKGCDVTEGDLTGVGGHPGAGHMGHDTGTCSQPRGDLGEGRGFQAGWWEWPVLMECSEGGQMIEMRFQKEFGALT